MKSFSSQIKKITNKYEKRFSILHRKVSADLFKRVIEKTPVDEGTARANWSIGINAIPKTYDKSKKDKDGSNTKSSIVIGLNALKLGDTAVLANSLPYIQSLEYGGYPTSPKKGTWDKKEKSFTVKSSGGYSKQAPQGMVGVTVEEYKPTLKKAIEAAKKGAS